MSADARSLAPASTDLARILDGLTTSVLLVDRAQTLLYLNVAAESLLGISRNQVRGRPLSELFRDTAGLSAVLERAAQTSQQYSRRELAIRPITSEDELVIDCSVAPFEEAGSPPACSSKSLTPRSTSV
jgi:two-component system nitrogen regulation sensor histidine kinase GlnL